MAAETAMDPVVIRMDGCCDAIAAAVKMFIRTASWLDINAQTILVTWDNEPI